MRNDIERLRRLGYPVEAQPGVAGGYRLGESATMPPMLLDDEEAVAVAVALGAASASPVEGVAEASVSALTKIQRLLPSRLRERVGSLRRASLPLPGQGSPADLDTLVTIAAACRNTEQLRFDYEGHDGSVTRRRVEPYRLVGGGGRWYLFSWDVERDDWRTFRVDRMTLRMPVGPRFAPKPVPPDHAITEHVSRGIATAMWRFRARVIAHAPAEYARARIPVSLRIVERGPDRCEVTIGSDDPRMLAIYLGMLDVEFEVVDSPELAEALREVAARFVRAAG